MSNRFSQELKIIVATRIRKKMNHHVTWSKIWSEKSASLRNFLIDSMTQIVVMILLLFQMIRMMKYKISVTLIAKVATAKRTKNRNLN